MSPAHREPRSGLSVSQLYRSPDQGWGAIVAGHVRHDWPPPAWLPLAWTGDRQDFAAHTNPGFIESSGDLLAG